MKQLKEFLKARGLDCKGCSEKADYVKLAYDHRDMELPNSSSVNENADDKNNASDAPPGGKIDQEKLDEVFHFTQYDRNSFLPIIDIS